MKLLRTYILSLLLAIQISGCERLFIEDDPLNNPVSNFEVFWHEFDRHYTFFELKQIDWDSVYTENRAKVDRNTTENVLFSILQEIIVSLEDGHSGIYRNNQFRSYDFKQGYPLNSPVNATRYLANIHYVNNTMIYAHVKDANLGYLWIMTFGGPTSDYKMIDSILETMKESDGIIIDVRSNGGGSDLKSDIIASRFADKKRLYKKTKYRNGPDRDDFTDWFDFYIKPDGNFQYLKPVIILTNRSTYSTAEDFVLAMKVLPHVTTVGGTTGGGSGNPILRELPNGWDFQLSAWFPVSSDLMPFESTGLIPDVPVLISEEDSISGVDTILEKAIDLSN